MNYLCHPLTTRVMVAIEILLHYIDIQLGSNITVSNSLSIQQLFADIKLLMAEEVNTIIVICNKYKQV